MVQNYFYHNMQNDIAILVKNKSVDNIICGNISNISIMLQKNPPVQEKKAIFAYLS